MAVRNTFFIAGYGPLQRSHQGDHQEIQVMVQVMGLFSVLIEETIMRLQGLHRVLIKDRAMRGRDLIMWPESKREA